MSAPHGVLLVLIMHLSLGSRSEKGLDIELRCGVFHFDTARQWIQRVRTCAELVCSKVKVLKKI